MKRLKWIVIGLGVLIVLIIAGVFLTLNGIVRRAVEMQASDSLNLQTTLGGANVSILGSSVNLSDLKIASPANFSAPQMFTLGGIDVDVSLGELRGDPVRVAKIGIDRPKFVIEQSGGKFNFQALTDLASKKAPDSGKPGDGTRDESEPIRLIIDDLAVNGAEVVVRPGIPGMQQEINIAIPSFQLKGIGTGPGNQNGAAIKEVVLLLVTTLVKKAAESDSLPPETRQLLSLNADQVKARIEGEINKEIESIKQDIGKKIEEGVGNLLNRGRSN